MVVPVLHLSWIYRNSSCSMCSSKLLILSDVYFCLSGYFSFPLLSKKMGIFSHIYGPFIFPFLWNLLPNWLLVCLFFLIIWGNSSYILDTVSSSNSLLASTLASSFFSIWIQSHSNLSEILLCINLFSLWRQIVERGTVGTSETSSISFSAAIYAVFSSSSYKAPNAGYGVAKCPVIKW